MQKRNFKSEFTFLVCNDQNIRATQTCESFQLAFFKKEEEKGMKQDVMFEKGSFGELVFPSTVEVGYCCHGYKKGNTN